MGIYAGFDPGGHNGFQWAVVSGDRSHLKLEGRGVAHRAQGAFEAVSGFVDNTKISAVGIDAPLFWIPTGDRRADQLVRKAIRKCGCQTAGGTVGAVNALRGACLIQGILVAKMYQQIAPSGTSITESHPKALLWLLGKATSKRRPNQITLKELREFVAGSKAEDARDHERDAVLGAYTALAMNSRLSGWRDLYPLETNAVSLLNPAPGYWMPVGLIPASTSAQPLPL